MYMNMDRLEVSEKDLEFKDRIREIKLDNVGVVEMKLTKMKYIKIFPKGCMIARKEREYMGEGGLNLLAWENLRFQKI